MTLGDDMKIIRAFNNNVISAWSEDKKEVILMGSGIGFQKKPGDLVDESKVEKRYVLDDQETHQFHQLYDKTSFKYFNIVEDIFSKAKDSFNYELGNGTLISLADHISFAIERATKGIAIPNLLLSEIKVLYEKEFRFGVWAIEYISEKTGISFPSDEAGYIAMHLINSSMDYQGTAAEIIQISSEIKSIIFSVYKVLSLVTDLDYSRLYTHLKYLAQRIIKNQNIQDANNLDESLYHLLIEKDSKMKTCIDLINCFLEQDYGRRLGRNEELYLIIHL